VKVVCRVRPLSEQEKQVGLDKVVSVNDVHTLTLVRGDGRVVRSSYCFDRIFDEEADQAQVFDETLRPMIDDALRGYEASMLAYGQTGTGKTHSIEGDVSSEEGRGMILRAAEVVFDRLQHPKYVNTTVTCSFLSLYNDEFSDLLADVEVVPLRLLEGTAGVQVQHLSEEPVASVQDLQQVLRRAAHRRHVDETNLNKNSSRAHCMFTLHLYVGRKCEGRRDGGLDGEMVCKGKLHLIDLAGSEGVKKSGIGPKDGQDRERKSINQSLLALNRVLIALKQGATRIPYRDSKLTRLLASALGGKESTCVLCTLSPSKFCVEETSATLSYAQQACGVTNRPTASARFRSNHAPMGAPGDGRAVQDWSDMEAQLRLMSCDLEEASAALAEKHLQNEQLHEELDRLRKSQAKALKDAAEAAQRQHNAEIRRAEAAEALAVKDEELRQALRSEQQFRAQTTALMSSLDASMEESARLHKLLDERCREQRESRFAAQRLRQECRSHLVALEQQAVEIVTVEKDVGEKLRSGIASLHQVVDDVAAQAFESGTATRDTVHKLQQEAAATMRQLKTTIAERVGADAEETQQAADQLTTVVGSARAKHGLCLEAVTAAVDAGEQMLSTMFQELQRWQAEAQQDLSQQVTAAQTGASDHHQKISAVLAASEQHLSEQKTCIAEIQKLLSEGLLQKLQEAWSCVEAVNQKHESATAAVQEGFRSVEQQGEVTVAACEFGDAAAGLVAQVEQGRQLLAGACTSLDDELKETGAELDHVMGAAAEGQAHSMALLGQLQELVGTVENGHSQVSDLLTLQAANLAEVGSAHEEVLAAHTQSHAAAEQLRSVVAQRIRDEQTAGVRTILGGLRKRAREADNEQQMLRQVLKTCHNPSPAFADLDSSLAGNSQNIAAACRALEEHARLQRDGFQTMSQQVNTTSREIISHTYLPLSQGIMEAIAAFDKGIAEQPEPEKVVEVLPNKAESVNKENLAANFPSRIAAPPRRFSVR